MNDAGLLIKLSFARSNPNWLFMKILEILLIPFMASHSTDPIQRLAIEGFWGFSSDILCGGSFQRGDEFVAPLKTLENLFSFQVSLADSVLENRLAVEIVV